MFERFNSGNYQSDFNKYLFITIDNYKYREGVLAYFFNTFRFPNWGGSHMNFVSGH